MRRRAFLSVLPVVLALSPLAYGEEKSPKVIKIGAVAYAPKVVTVWEGMIRYFRGQGIPTDYVLYSNYDALVDAFVAKEVDVAWNSPLAYAEAQRRMGGVCNILAMGDVDVRFTSKFITRAGSGIRSLDDLKGKTFAVGSRDSVEAAILPLHFLRQQGIDPEKDLKLVRFDEDLGKHGNTGVSEQRVVQAVQNGQADAGVVGQYMWNFFVTKGQINPSQFEVFWTTPPFGFCNFTVRPDFDPEIARKLTRAFLAMDYSNPEHKTLLDLEGFKGFVPGQKEAYKPLEEALK